MAAIVPVPLPSEKQLKDVLKNLKYSHAGRTVKHIMTTVDSFPNLRPSVKEYVHSTTGKMVDLMQLSGTILVIRIYSELHVPIRIWLEKSYPKDIPIVNINLAADMTLVTGVRYVKENGDVDLQYITEWKEGKSDLCTMLQALQTKFTEQCPVNIVKLRSVSALFGNRRTPAQTKSSHEKTSSDGSSASFVQSCCLENFSHNSLKKTRSVASACAKPIEPSCNCEEELTQLKFEIEDQRAKLELVINEKEILNGKVKYYRNQFNEMEEKIKSQQAMQRGSFSAGVFDALMEHDIWKEKKENEEQMKRMARLVSSLTEVREQNGILHADKEEYQERLSLLMDKYRCVKRDYCNLVKERNILLKEIVSVQSKLESTSNALIQNHKRQSSRAKSFSVPAFELQSDQNHQLTNNTQECELRSRQKSDLEDSKSCAVQSEHSKPSNEIPDMPGTPRNPPKPLDGIPDMASAHSLPKPLDETLDMSCTPQDPPEPLDGISDMPSAHSLPKPLDETLDMSCTPQDPPEPLDLTSEGPHILCDSSPSESDTELPDEQLIPHLNTLLKQGCKESKVKVSDHITSKRSSGSHETETLQDCKEVKMNPELETKDKLSISQATTQTDSPHQRDDNGEVEVLKKLLDDAMRKIRKFKYFSDKEEQLEKQKQSLLAQIDRNNEIHSTIQTKLGNHHKKAKVELKEALSRSQELEREVQALQQSLSEVLNTGSSIRFDCTSLGEQSQLNPDDKDMTCVINHLDRLLSK